MSASLLEILDEKIDHLDERVREERKQARDNTLSFDERKSAESFENFYKARREEVKEDKRKLIRATQQDNPEKLRQVVSRLTNYYRRDLDLF